MQEENKWDNLSTEEKNIYLQRARYLIEYGYIMNRDIEDLAIEIYSKRRVKKS
jgi:hypothetical protein